MHCRRVTWRRGQSLVFRTAIQAPASSQAAIAGASPIGRPSSNLSVVAPGHVERPMRVGRGVVRAAARGLSERRLFLYTDFRTLRAAMRHDAQSAV